MIGSGSDWWRGYSPDMTVEQVRAEYARAFGAPPERVEKHNTWLAGPIEQGSPVSGVVRGDCFAEGARNDRREGPLFERPDGVMV